MGEVNNARFKGKLRVLRPNACYARSSKRWRRSVTVKPLLLVFEDLHWADPSTVDFISALARRRSGGKLMLIGTYRPVDVALVQHPLKTVKQDLLVHQLCREIALEAADGRRSG